MLLHELLTRRRLLLASHSPRRRALLEACGLPFTPAQPFEVQERYPSDLDPRQVPAFLAALKSDAYPFPLAPSDILLTADTVVILEGEVLGKPSDRAAAEAMLRRLSGRRHEVVTGIVLRSPAARRAFTATTSVWFRALGAEEIAYYLSACAPYDKAGSYGIQEWIGYVGVERIDGSFYNVMGLPIQQVYSELEAFVQA